MDLVSRIRNRLAPRSPIPTGKTPVLTPLPGIRAVIFDVYGTLFTSSSGDIGAAAATDNRAALRDALRDAGLPEDAARIDDWIAAVQASHQTSRQQGVSHPEVEVRGIWRQIVRAPASPAQLAALAVEYECRVNPAWPMPGCKSILARLHEHGRLLGIVSNAQFYTPLLFEACLDHPPDALGLPPALCAWSYQLREAKPSPRLFAPVVAELARRDLSPHQALYVGNDMLNDIWTAGQAGLHTCLFAGDQRSLRLRESDERCQSLQPDRVITALDQLADLLNPPPRPHPPYREN
jgi:putative hydrolase of the HAD superfamily